MGFDNKKWSMDGQRTESMDPGYESPALVRDDVETANQLRSIERRLDRIEELLRPKPPGQI